MLPARNNNMFLVCVTVGLVFLASKYRNNVLRSVKHLYKNLRNRDNRRSITYNNCCKAANDGGNNAKNTNDNDNNNNKKNSDDKKEFKIILDKIILADSPEKCDYAVQRIRWWV